MKKTALGNVSRVVINQKVLPVQAGSLAGRKAKEGGGLRGATEESSKKWKNRGMNTCPGSRLETVHDGGVYQKEELSERLWTYSRSHSCKG